MKILASILFSLFAIVSIAQEYTFKDSKGNLYTLQPTASGGYTPTLVGTQEQPPKADFSRLYNTVATVSFEVQNTADAPYLAKYEGAYTASQLMGERHQRIAYQQVKSGRQYYYAPVLSVNPGASITLRASVEVNDKNIQPDSIFFSTQEGERLTPKYSEGQATLTLTSGTPGESRRYYALCPLKDKGLVVVGAFEVVTYVAKTVNVALVPVNGYGEGINVPELQEYLNKVYGPANVSFTLTKERSFDYGGNLKLLEGKSGLLEAYTDTMQVFNRAYVAHVGSDFRKDALYLFFANYGGGKGKAAAGFMPRQQQLGYIFVADADGEVYRTVAHELGHGAANLAHTFDATKYGIAEGSTSNLMDYANGTELTKLQWDQLHSPGEVWKIFEKDEDGMLPGGNVLVRDLVDEDGNPIKFDIKNSPCKYFFIAPQTVAYFTETETSKIGSLFIDANGHLKSITNADGSKTYIRSLIPIFGKKEDGSQTIAQRSYDYRYICFQAVDEYIQNHPNLKGIEDIRKEKINEETVYYNVPNKEPYTLVSFAKNIKSCAEFVKQNGTVLYYDKNSKTFACKAAECPPSETTIKYCAQDLYSKPSDVGINGNKTYGELNLKTLTDLIQYNKNLNYEYGNDLKSINVGEPTYISVGIGSNGSIFKEKDYILSELNKKMAYLEVSTGYQLYTMFFEHSCTQTQEQANQTARKFLDEAKMGDKAILCVLINNNEERGAAQYATVVGLAFGSKAKDIEKLIKEKLGSVIPTKELNFTNRLVACYKAIPKKQYVNKYYIQSITTEEKAAYDKIESEFRSGKRDDLPALTSTIKAVKEIAINATGNVFENQYYRADGSNLSRLVVGQGQELKEEYVSRNVESLTQSDYGRDVALQLAGKYAGWKHNFCRRALNEGEGLKCGSTEPTVYNYVFTLQKPLTNQLIDAGFLVATVVTPSDYVAIPIAAATVYYTYRGETEIAIAYLAGYGLGEVAGKIIGEGIVKAQQLQQYYRLQKSIRAVAKEFDASIAQSTSQALVEFYEKPLSNTCHEWIVAAENSSNYWIKSEGNAVMVGKVTTSTSGEAKVVYYASDLKSGKIITESADENMLKEVVKDLVGIQQGGILEKYKVAIFDKIKIIARDESLSPDIVKTFLDGYYYTGVASERIVVFRRFGDEGVGQAKLFGGFSSTEAVLSRNELAILTKWSNMQFEVEIIPDIGAKLNLGKIAPQTGYTGGADQVLLPLDYPESWVKNIKDLKTGKVYNLEDFKHAFPNLIGK